MSLNVVNETIIINNHSPTHSLIRIGNPFTPEIETTQNIILASVVSSSVNGFKCLWMECPKMFDNKNLLGKHVKEDHVSSTRFTRNFCCLWNSCHRKESPFKFYCDLVQHVVFHTGEKPFTCNVTGCQKSYTRKAQLSVHMLIHEGKKSHLCKTCGKGLMSLYALKMHAILHTKVYPLDCNLCTKKFRYSTTLRTHLVRFHSKRFDFKCTYCPKTFKTTVVRGRHESTHNVHFQCNFHNCTAVFYCTNSLNQHLQDFHFVNVHQIQQPQQSTLIDRSAHENMHGTTTKRLYKCAFYSCSKAYSSLSFLHKHIAKVHPNDNGAYTCGVCFKNFQSPFEISKHQKQHFPNVPFICDIKNCNKNYTTFSALSRHKRDSHFTFNPVVFVNKPEISETGHTEEMSFSDFCSSFADFIENVLLTDKNDIFPKSDNM